MWYGKRFIWIICWICFDGEIIILLIYLSLVTPYAIVGVHSGRTDAYGGHHDYKNKSGLGSYHYHCGGHPAHLHDNGVCPYSSNYTSTTSHKRTKKVSKYYKASTVRKVQKKLNKLGYKCGKVDGSYGKKTKIDIRKYQRKKGMTVNGKINKSLCKKLHIRV